MNYLGIFLCAVAELFDYWGNMMIALKVIKPCLLSYIILLFLFFFFF